MARRRRRRPVGSNRPEATAAYVIAVISFISAFTCVLCIYLAMLSKGNTENWLGGMGVLFIILEMICFVTGYRIFRNTNYTLRSRLVGFLAPLPALVMWTGIYLMGIFYG